MISLGLISFSNKILAFPASRHSCFFSSLRAGLENYSKLIPKASMAEDMVLAVYIPPQAPAPGHAF
jgi:hypothetical protein